MAECSECLADNLPLHPNGMCNMCITFREERPKFGREARGDFKFETDMGKAIPTYICGSCGGDRFIVGRSHYHTAMKCPTCGWERCIHDG